ncbi:MAG: D-aminoacylase [Chloroflexi bacterium]|nr:D-aminoacylase [Chloroflexota bacterium]
MLDLVIKGGTVIDGTGAAGFRADIGIVDDRIAVVAQGIDGPGAQEIDASGLCVTPGFIDPHTHSDLTLIVDPCAQSKIRQGVTTEIVGNCGFSGAPVLGDAHAQMSAEAAQYDLTMSWATVSEYLGKIRDTGAALNVVPLLGHNTVRGCVLGYDDVQPTAAQQAEMERLVAEAMEQGTRGLSTGLYYPPGYYAGTDEVVGLAAVTARYGGIYASHIRGECDTLLTAVAEAVEIGERADIVVEIAHLKVEGFSNWHLVEDLLRVLDSLQASGARVGCDQYPYRASSTWLAAMLPYWAQTGGSESIAQRVADPVMRATLREDWEQNQIEWQNRGGVRDWSEVLISACEERPDVLGKTIAEVADLEHRDPLDVFFDLIIISRGQASAVWFDQNEDIVQTLMRHPLVAVGSDGAALSPEGPLGRQRVHPRNYGTFPRVLGRYVREKRVLALEEAVRKMTSMTAERYSVEDRGVVREGAYADIVLFNAGAVADRSTFADPLQYPAGIPYVIVNGQVVVEQERHTGALPGRVL